MTKKEIKDAFRQQKVQLSPSALTLIEDDLKRQVTIMAKRCSKGNVKRLTAELYFIAIGKL
tara:strand:+ start:467 stop:649 length:183 start_codon:yes stop_codon:yes gene_type:complete